MSKELDPMPLINTQGHRVGFGWYMVASNTFAPRDSYEQDRRAYMDEWTEED